MTSTPPEKLNLLFWGGFLLLRASRGLLRLSVGRVVALWLPSGLGAGRTTEERESINDITIEVAVESYYSLVEIQQMDENEIQELLEE
ncbi:hypothetical protein Hamer_G001734 [Homarus americanus]|uniref:Uncharacterized protein n=1 Tax=Homarus americanus TaxID=6706 RepID=A0A8J5JLI7_HOMAM|nr:hypothetical protein Hamer_G001734 [Homarus americanus]